MPAIGAEQTRARLRRGHRARHANGRPGGDGQGFVAGAGVTRRDLFPRRKLAWLTGKPRHGRNMPLPSMTPSQRPWEARRRPSSWPERRRRPPAGSTGRATAHVMFRCDPSLRESIKAIAARGVELFCGTQHDENSLRTVLWKARPCGRISENIGQGIPKSLFR